MKRHTGFSPHVVSIHIPYIPIPMISLCMSCIQLLNLSLFHLLLSSLADEMLCLPVACYIPCSQFIHSLIVRDELEKREEKIRQQNGSNIRILSFPPPSPLLSIHLTHLSPIAHRVNHTLCTGNGSPELTIHSNLTILSLPQSNRLFFLHHVVLLPAVCLHFTVLLSSFLKDLFPHPHSM